MEGCLLSTFSGRAQRVSFLLLHNSLGLLLDQEVHTHIDLCGETLQGLQCLKQLSMREVNDHSAEFWSFFNAHDPLNVVIDDVADQLLPLGLIAGLELFSVEETHHLVVEDDGVVGRRCLRLSLGLRNWLRLWQRHESWWPLHSLYAHLTCKLRLPILHVRVDLIVLNGVRVLAIGNAILLLLASIHLHPHLLRCLVRLWRRRHHGLHLLLVALVLLRRILLGRDLVRHLVVVHLGHHLGLLLLLELGLLVLRGLLCILIIPGPVVSDVCEGSIVHVLVGLPDLVWAYSVGLVHWSITSHVGLLVATNILVLAIVALLSVAIVVVVVMATLIVVSPVPASSILIADAPDEHADSLHDLLEGEV